MLCNIRSGFAEVCMDWGNCQLLLRLSVAQLEPMCCVCIVEIIGTPAHTFDGGLYTLWRLC